MSPWRILGRAVFLTFGFAATLGVAAEAPYFDDFNAIPPSGIPLNFVENADADWFLSGGAYHGQMSLFSADKRIGSSINLSNVAGRNFTVTTKFSVAMAGAGVSRIMDVSLGALGTNSDLNTGQGYVLNYNLAGANNQFGLLNLGGWTTYQALTPTSGPYVMRLHGGYVDGIPFFSGAITSPTGTRSIRAAGGTPVSGSNFGFLEHLFTGVQRSASLDVAHDEFSVVFESEPVKLAKISSWLNMRGPELVTRGAEPVKRGTKPTPILGFVIGGNATKKILIRIEATDGDPFSRDPVLELYDHEGHLLMRNDNWADTQGPEIAYYGLVPLWTQDAALIVTLEPGSYTAVAYDRDENASRSFLEIYDLEEGVESRLVNVSARAYVDQSDQPMTFAISPTGDAKIKVLVRALGPSLRANGISGTLTDPTLELYDTNGTLVAANNNWRDTQETEIAATGLAPRRDAEAAIIAELLPFNYSVIVRGNHSTGTAMVEVYHLN